MILRIGLLLLASLSPLITPRTLQAQQDANQNETQAALFDGQMAVTFQDDFEAQTLSDDWISTLTQATLAEGQLVVDAAAEDTELLSRPNINEGEGVLILFQSTGGAMDFRLQTGTPGTPEYQRWSFAQEERWKGQFMIGQVNYDQDWATLEEDVWYYVLLRVGEDATFFIDVWARDSTSNYVYQHQRTFWQEGWDNATWDFALHVQRGQLRVARYNEVRVASDFVLPAAPMLHPDDILYSEDFDALDLDDWYYQEKPTLEALDGNSALRLTGDNSLFSDLVFSGADYTLLVDTRVTEVDPDYNAFQVGVRVNERGAYYASLDVGVYLSFIDRYAERKTEQLTRGRGSNLRRDTWHTVRFRVTGDDLKVFVDQYLIVYATDDQVESGGIALLVAPAAVVYFDNLRIVDMTP